MLDGVFWYPRDILDTYMMCWSMAVVAAAVAARVLVRP